MLHIRKLMWIIPMNPSEIRKNKHSSTVSEQCSSSLFSAKHFSFLTGSFKLIFALNRPSPQERNFKLPKFDIINFNKSKQTEKKIETESFFLGEWKRIGTKVAEYYCWATKEAAGRSYWGRSGSSVLKFVFQVDSLLYIRIVNDTYTQFQLAPDLPERDNFLSRRVSVFTRHRDIVDIGLTQVLIYKGSITQETLVKTRVRRSHPRRMRFSFWSANGFFCVAAYAASSQVSETITCWIHWPTPCSTAQVSEDSNEIRRPWILSRLRNCQDGVVVHYKLH
jgi:hypothetical protein